MPPETDTETLTDWDAYQATEPRRGNLYACYAGALFFCIDGEGSVLVDEYGARHDADELIESIGTLTLVRAN